MTRGRARYFLAEDGEVGVRLDDPVSGPAFDTLVRTLRRTYPDLEEVSREEYRAAEREREASWMREARA